MPRFHERARRRRQALRATRPRAGGGGTGALGRGGGGWNLPTPLIDFTGRGDRWSIGDALEGTIIKGGPGSGKIPSSGRTLLHARHPIGSSDPESESFSC